MAKQRAAPTIAPTTAVTAERKNAPKKEPRIGGLGETARLSRVNAPFASRNPLPTAITVGMARKTTT